MKNQVVTICDGCNERIGHRNCLFCKVDLCDNCSYTYDIGFGDNHDTLKLTFRAGSGDYSHTYCKKCADGLESVFEKTSERYREDGNEPTAKALYKLVMDFIMKLNEIAKASSL